MSRTFVHLNNLIHLFKIELRIHTLAVHVHRHSEDVHITGALTITKKRALNTIGAGKQGELRSRYSATSVVMGMNRNQHGIASFNVLAKPLNLVRVDIRRTHLHGGR